MDTVPALAGIIAKVLVLIDKALGAFVVLDTEPVSEGCDIVRYTANITPAGEALADNLAQLLFSYISNLAGELTAALTATNYT